MSGGLPASSWSACAISAAGNKMIVASQTGLIYTSADSGTTWTSNTAPALSWNSVASSADGTRLFALVFGGGIWRSQTTPAPQLHATSSSGNVHLAWTVPSLNFVLQQNADCAATGWEDVTNPPALNLLNLQYGITLPSAADRGFYRLKSL
jgi:hypothetical protein